MYSIVLATLLTTGAGSPAWFCHGCHGCSGCHGCHGCCGGCYGCHGCCGGCCGGCYGCSGCCGGCYGGCYGCSGCYGCGGGCFGCSGCCGGCYGGCFGCSGCSGCMGCGCGYAVIGAPAVASALPNQATIVVQGVEGAQLYADGQLIKESGSSRTFVSPELQPGRDYYYTLKVKRTRDGKAVTQSKRVYVRAGQTARVDFTATATARVTVRLPKDARLTVDGVPFPSPSTTRTFETPRLDAGRQYYYTLRAEVVREGQPRAASRRVVVEAGKDVQVDFRNLEPVRTASR